MRAIPAITSFRGEHAFLSNFHPSPIVMYGIEFPTLEHAFQAHKTLSLDDRMHIAALPTPGQAKRAGRLLKLRPLWDEIKLMVMLELLRLKFAEGTKLAHLLLATGDRDLIEGNDWNDTFWGMVKIDRIAQVPSWRGENHLGKLLMQVREELRDNA